MSASGQCRLDHYARYPVDRSVGCRLVTPKSPNIGGDEYLDRVTQPTSDLTERYAGSEPRRRCRMTAVVEAERLMTYSPEGAMPCPKPIRRCWPVPAPGAKQQRICVEPLAFDPARQALNENRWDRHITRAGLRLTRHIVGNVGLDDTEQPPALGR